MRAPGTQLYFQDTLKPPFGRSSSSTKIVTMKIVHLCLICITCEHRPVFSVSFNFSPSLSTPLHSGHQPDLLGTKKKKRIRFKCWKFNRSQKYCQELSPTRNPQENPNKMKRNRTFTIRFLLMWISLSKRHYLFHEYSHVLPQVSRSDIALPEDRHLPLD